MCVLESPFHRVLCEGGVFRDHHHSIWVGLHPETIGSNVIKRHQMSSNVIIMFLSTFWDDFPHTFLKSKPYSPCLDEVPGMLLQVVQLLHWLLQCQVLVHPVIIILINIVMIR